MTDFLSTRGRDWWRSYYCDAVARAEMLLERPLTLTERKQVVRIIRHKRKSEMLGSSSVLGIFISMAIREPGKFNFLVGREAE